MIPRKSPVNAPVTDPARSAHVVGLRYVTDQMPGIQRERSGQGFRYRYPTGDLVSDTEVLKRIKSLAIPPAWQEVWICPDPAGHLQATGRDDRGRKQSRYHPKWREVRDETKFARMIAFGNVLPKVRRRVERDLALPGLPRNKVLATVVRLLEVSHIRVGNEAYARDNETFGLTTLRDRHVEVKGASLRFHFRGKSGQPHHVSIQDRRLARIVRTCQELPGQELFQYVTDAGERQAVNSEDVNEYLREITQEDFTAKDFRTWSGTVLGALALAELANFGSQTQARKSLVQGIKTVAQQLGNTPAVCRKCYVHPDVIDAFMDGSLLSVLTVISSRRVSSNSRDLDSAEAAVLKLLQARLKATDTQLPQLLKDSLRNANRSSAKARKHRRTYHPIPASAK